MPPILIDIESSSSVKLGPGPVSALSWRWTRKLDRAGTIAFSTPATDSRAGILSERRYARCYSQIAGTRTEIGLGIIDKIDLDTNTRELTVGGDDLMRELALRSVGSLPLVGALQTPITIAAALDAIIALAPGWTLDRTTYAAATVDVFYTFSGESVLAALGKVASMTGTHFRLGTGREVVWLFDAQPASGIRAVIGVDPIAAESNQDICLITALSYIRDSSDVISRIYPHGSGTGAARLDLSGTTRSAPSGYVLSTGSNYIERTDAETDYGFAVRHQSFNDVAPSVEDTDPNYAAAKVNAQNTLYDLAYEYLRTHSYPQESYKLTVTKLDRLVLPGETIRVTYNGWVDGYKWVDIDADLLVLEATTEITNGGIHVPSLTVATLDRWPVSDLELLIALTKQVAQAQAHDQPVTTAQVSGAQVVVTPGKTLTVSNDLTLSGTDGEALTLTGSLGVGADTTISGGGTLALGGYTATVAATGTVAMVGTSVTLLDADVTATTISNDNTEQTLYSYSVPGGTLSTANKLRLVMIGAFLNNTGGNAVPTIKVKYGATTILSDVPAALAFSASAHGWRVESELVANNATNAQIAIGTTHIGSTAGLTGVSNGTTLIRTAVHATVAEDSTSAKNLVVTVTLPSASTSLTFTCYNVFLEVVRK